MVDLQEIDQLTKELYAAISFKPGGQPGLDRLPGLFQSPGTLINNNGDQPVVWDPEDFIETYRQQIESGAVVSFVEEEISSRTELFGAVAQRFSTYQARFRTAKGDFAVRGINSIQFLRTDNAWRVVSILWFDENEDHRIPIRYLQEC